MINAQEGGSAMKSDMTEFTLYSGCNVKGEKPKIEKITDSKVPFEIKLNFVEPIPYYKIKCAYTEPGDETGTLKYDGCYWNGFKKLCECSHLSSFAGIESTSAAPTPTPDAPVINTDTNDTGGTTNNTNGGGTTDTSNTDNSDTSNTDNSNNNSTQLPTEDKNSIFGDIMFPKIIGLVIGLLTTALLV